MSAWMAGVAVARPGSAMAAPASTSVWYARSASRTSRLMYADLYPERIKSQYDDALLTPGSPVPRNDASPITKTPNWPVLFR